MHTKILILTSILLWNVSCADSSKESLNPNGGQIGTSVSKISQDGVSLDVRFGGKTMYTYDEPTHSVQSFDTTTMTLNWSQKIRDKSPVVGIEGTVSGSYAIVYQNKSVVVYGAKGKISQSNLNFQGTPKSTAFNEETGYLIMYDDLASIGIYKFDNSGKIESSTLLGPILDAKKAVYAGDIDSNSNLYLAMSDYSVLKVDLKASLENKAWSYEVFYTNDQLVTWIGESSSGYLMLTDNEKVMSLSPDDGGVVASEEISWIYSSSKAEQPHILALREGEENADLMHVGEDGSFVLHTLSGAFSSLGVAQRGNYYSTINSEGDQITFVSRSSVYTIRLNDGLVLATMNHFGKDLFINRDSFVSIYPSVLGKLVKTNIADGEQTELKYYNIPYL